MIFPPTDSIHTWFCRGLREELLVRLSFVPPEIPFDLDSLFDLSGTSLILTLGYFT